MQPVPRFPDAQPPCGASAVHVHDSTKVRARLARRDTALLREHFYSNGSAAHHRIKTNTSMHGAAEGVALYTLSLRHSEPPNTARQPSLPPPPRAAPIRSQMVPPARQLRPSCVSRCSRASALPGRQMASKRYQTRLWSVPR